MAPTATANASIPIQSGQGFGGDEFSNNLFSDLAPLLTLFGEQVTKQFVSMSMGWADNVLLAMGPLGIMTVIVSAIRVGGIKSLKAFVGRARESKASAEKEILSSTSEDVCELWSGREIVRELGNPGGMKDLILLDEKVENVAGNRVGQSPTADTQSRRVFDISTAVSAHVMHRPDGLLDEELPGISNGAPNIALNVRNSTVDRKELIAWALVGTALQLSALIFPVVTTHYLKWKKGGSTISSYGYPCFATGTVAVIIGMIFCGRVIEGSTTEHEFKLKTPSGTERSGAQILRLQKACTVSDQHFASYAIFNSPKDASIRTSRLNQVSYSRLAAFATLMAVLGFILQFVGLRALHWSATIYQLGVMLILTIVRSLVRRGLATDPVFYPLLDGHEIAWLTLYMLWGDEDETQSRQSSNETGVSLAHRGSKASERRQNVRADASAPSRTNSLSSIAPEETQKPATSSGFFKMTWPPRFFATKTPKREMEADERMLETLARWEPFTGYYTVKTVRKSILSSLNQSGCPKLVRDTLSIDDARLGRAFFSLQDTYDERNFQIMSNLQPLEIYGDLQRLMPSSGEAFYIGGILAATIERVMDLISTSRQMRFQSSWFGVPFNVSIVRGTYDSRASPQVQRLQLSVDGRRVGADSVVWSTDRTIISSILSLWHFSLELRKSAAMKLCINSLKLYPTETLVEGAEQLYDYSNVFYRIVGFEETTDKRVEYWDRAISKWLSQPVEPAPLFGEYQSSERMAQVSLTTSGPHTLSGWAVWGSRFSASFSGSFKSQDLGENVYDLAVRTRAETTVVRQCALELFSSFMDAIAEQTVAIGGKTTSWYSGGEEIRDQIPGLRNTLLQSLASECVSTGLAHDIDEAYTVIVPSFLKHDLLPNKEHEEVRILHGDSPETTKASMLKETYTLKELARITGARKLLD